MLILKAYVNKKEIDEIYIQNVEHIEGDEYRYKVRKPDKYSNVEVTHYRSLGWKYLAEAILYEMLLIDERKTIKK